MYSFVLLYCSQVSLNWLNQRLNDGPTEADMKLLQPEDSLVLIKMSSSSKQMNTPNSFHSSLESSGLSGYVEKDSLKCNFTLNIDPVDVFGKLSTDMNYKENTTALWRKMTDVESSIRMDSPLLYYA